MAKNRGKKYIEAVKLIDKGKAYDLKAACTNGANVMPPLVEAVKAYATVGEISDVMREVFATYEEPAVF